MDLKKLLKDGINNSDWKKIVKAYKALFNEEISIPAPKNDPTITEIINILNRNGHVDLLNSNEEEDLDSGQIYDEDSEEPIPIDINSNKTEFIGVGATEPEKDDPKYIETMERLKERAKTRTTRTPYKKDMRTCAKCGTKFDFRAEFPVGKMSETKEERCSRCLLPQKK